MLETLLLVVGGAFVGWHFPQPFWAVMLENKVKSWWASIGK